MTFKLLTEQRLEFLSLKWDCAGSSESTLVKKHIVGNLMLQLNLHCLQIKKIHWQASFGSLTRGSIPHYDLRHDVISNNLVF